MTVTIQRLEELSFRTLPALDQDRYDGWVLRWSDGGSRRANSVNALGASSLSLSEKIAYCEDWFAERGSPAIFRLTALADAALDDELASRGYEYSGATHVMTADLTRRKAHPGVTTSAKPSDEWLRTIDYLSSADDSTIHRLRDQLLSTGGTSSFASVEVEDRVAAIGVAIDLDGHTTIYNMNTAEHSRRRGYARAILETLMANGRAAGGSWAVLQVTDENAPALALYRGAGFVTVYSYHYRQPSG
jgi:ribosomal protein S18 acetylase RimI-like enzyme